MQRIQAKLAIFDQEIGSGLCTYLVQHPLGLIPVLCGSWGELAASEACIGLVQAVLWDESEAQRARSLGMQLFVLDEHDLSPYQPADGLLRQVYQRAAEQRVYLPAALRALHEKKEVVAVCSPHGYDQQTGFAFVYSLLRAEQCRTLYLDFTYYNGFFGQQEKEKDVGALFYELHKHMQTAGEILAAMAQRFGALAYVPPVHVQMDLEDLTETDFTALLQCLLQESDYELVVLNLPVRPSFLRAVFDGCSRMYSLQREGVLYERAQNRLLEEFGILRTELEQSHFKALVMPPISGSFSLDVSMYEELLFGEMAGFIRTNLAADFNRVKQTPYVDCGYPL